MLVFYISGFIIHIFKILQLRRSISSCRVSKICSIFTVSKWILKNYVKLIFNYCLEIWVDPVINLINTNIHNNATTSIKRQHFIDKYIIERGRTRLQRFLQINYGSSGICVLGTKLAEKGLLEAFAFCKFYYTR